MTTARKRRTYDNRFRELIPGTGDIQIATRLGVPHSTARGWTRSSAPGVVTLNFVDSSTLKRDVILLRERNTKLIAVLRLLIFLTKVLAITQWTGAHHGLWTTAVLGHLTPLGHREVSRKNSRMS